MYNFLYFKNQILFFQNRSSKTLHLLLSVQTSHCEATKITNLTYLFRFARCAENGEFSGEGAHLGPHDDVDFIISMRDFSFLFF